MRDEVARCGFTSYMALPLFDLHTNLSYGVLELLTGGCTATTYVLLSTLDQALQTAGLRSTHNSISDGGFTINTVNTLESEREKGKRKVGLHLSLEDLKPHFGKKLKDVAQELGIGRSTIKRACRGYGIDRWPSKEKYKNNPSHFQRKSGSDSQQDANTKGTLHAIVVEEEEEKVIIKVKYEEDIIKFELCLSSGFAKLIEEVGTRLNLEKGAFKLKYTDEDGDEILLTNDADLQLCRKTQIAMNKTYIQLFVRL